MNKKKYLEIRKIEKKANECYEIDDRIDKFLKDNEEYLNDLTDDKTNEAIDRMIKYQKLLYSQARALNSLASEEFSKYREECQHEIIFHDDRGGPYASETHEYYCPLCRDFIHRDEVLDDSLVIGIMAMYNCEEPSQGDISYDVIDYLIENDLDLTEEEFCNALELICPRRLIYGNIKDDYKVRIKK